MCENNPRRAVRSKSNLQQTSIYRSLSDHDNKPKSSAHDNKPKPSMTLAQKLREKATVVAQLNVTHPGRAPSCGGCARRESALSNTMHLSSYSILVNVVGVHNVIFGGALLLLAIVFCVHRVASPELMVTLFYATLYFIASPAAILCNKILLKDLGFGYPVMVSALGQAATAVCAWVVVRCGGETVENGRTVSWNVLLTLGGASALALVLGQYPYLYLTVAFVQMLKAFSPAYMVGFLYCLGVERPSRNVILCVLGLSTFTAIASAGEVNFSAIGVSFMVAASCSDALRLVLAQKLLTNCSLKPLETLYYVSPICLMWMLPVALMHEVPTALRRESFLIVLSHPMLFLASGFSGFFVNLTSFLLVKRTSSMTLKTMTMSRNGALVLFSALAMGETVTSLEAVGYGGLLLCFTLYTYFKAQDNARAKAEREADMRKQNLIGAPSV